MSTRGALRLISNLPSVAAIRACRRPYKRDLRSSWPASKRWIHCVSAEIPSATGLPSATATRWHEPATLSSATSARPARRKSCSRQQAECAAPPLCNAASMWHQWPSGISCSFEGSCNPSGRFIRNEPQSPEAHPGARPVRAWRTHYLIVSSSWGVCQSDPACDWACPSRRMTASTNDGANRSMTQQTSDITPQSDNRMWKPRLRAAGRRERCSG